MKKIILLLTISMLAFTHLAAQELPVSEEVQEQSSNQTVNSESSQELVTFSGRVMQQDGATSADATPLSYAIVVIEELDNITESGEDGYFDFFDIPAGTYTLIIIAEGYEDERIAIVAGATSSDNVFVLSASDEQVFQSEEIVVRGDRFRNSTSGKRVYSREEIDTLPLIGDDPISIVEQETGMISDRQSNRGGPQTLTRGRLYSLSTEYSLYGGDTGWNRYFYGNIQIPTNTHVANPSTSVITRRAVESVESYKGMPVGIYGAGFGSTVVMMPRLSKDNWLSLDLSPTDPAVGLSYWFTKQVSLFVSARYSIANWIIVPLTNLVIDDLDFVEGEVKNLDYSDAIVSLNFTPTGHKISVLGLGFYDQSLANIAVTPPNSQTNNRFVGEITQTPIFGATGLSWLMQVGDKGQNNFNTYVSNYNSTNDILVDISGDALSVQYSYYGFVNTLDYRLINHYQWLISDTKALTVGGEFQYMRVTGSHTDEYKYVNKLNTVQSIDTKDNYTVDETVRKAYGFGEYAWTTGIWESALTLGVSQLFDESLDYSDIVQAGVFPSARAATDINMSQNWKLSLSASISPSFIEGSKYADRLISEEIVDYNSRTSYTSPTYGITTVPKLTWQINDYNSMFLEPFFAYYYNFSGFVPTLTVNNVAGESRGYLYITPKRGISTGAALAYELSKENHLFTTSYTLGFATYETDKYGWISPSEDYRHQYKASYTFRKFKAFQVGVVASILIDNPFTPVSLTANTDPDVKEDWVSNTGEPFSARNYVPELDLTVSLSGTMFKTKNAEFTYRFQPGNILGMLDINDEGVLNKYEGATNKDVDNRNIQYSFAPQSLLQNSYLGLEVIISLP